MFTKDNTNGLYSSALLNEMNSALEKMLGTDTGWIREQNEKNFSDLICEVAVDGMTSEDIIAATKR